MTDMIEHLNGIPWNEAPIPRRFHICRAQTFGFLYGRWIDRCACGAIRSGSSGWMRRNERRKSR